MTQRAFAQEARVPASTLCHLLNGTRRYLRSDTYERIRSTLARLEASATRLDPQDSTQG